MTTSTYSIDMVEFSWLGLNFKGGLATGSSIVETHNAAGATRTASAVGNGIDTYDPNNTGQLTFLFDQTSVEHQQLLAVWNAFKNPNTRKDQYGTGVMRDNSSGYVIDYTSMSIAKDPEETRGTEAAALPWVFNFTRRNKKPIANPTNVVG